MGKKRFFLNLDTCIGCHSCQYACQEKKGLDAGQWFRRVLHLKEIEYQGAYSAGCNHCEQPACVAICPNGAMYRDETLGLVLHCDEKCIGCGSCMWACPYGAISTDSRGGVAAKCDGCVTETEKGKLPHCVAACPTESLKYVDEDEMQGVMVTPPEYAFLPKSSLTRPSTRIVKKEEQV